MITLKALKSSKIIRILGLIALITLSILSVIAPSKAGDVSFHVIFSTDPNDPYYTQHKLFISYEVYVWSNGHVEVYATYCCYNSDPNAWLSVVHFPAPTHFTVCRLRPEGFWFYPLGTKIQFIPGFQLLLTVAPIIVQTPKYSNSHDLNPDTEYCSQGRPMYIAIQLCLNTVYLYKPYAVIQMTLFYSPLGAIGLLSSNYIVFTGHAVMDPPPYH